MQLQTTRSGQTHSSFDLPLCNGRRAARGHRPAEQCSTSFGWLPTDNGNWTTALFATASGF
eukprot:4495612-Alexandrium_andersonii.AAC.1